MPNGKEYPGLTPLMLKTMNEGITQYGGIKPTTNYNSLPLERSVRPSTVGNVSNVGVNRINVNNSHNNFNDMKRSAQQSSSLSDGSDDVSWNKTSDGNAPEDENSVITKLTKQCNNLAWRLVDLESELKIAKEFNRKVVTSRNVIEDLKVNNIIARGAPSRKKNGGGKRHENEETDDVKAADDRLLPIEKSTVNLRHLINEVTKSLYGDDKDQSESAEMAEKLKMRKREEERREVYLEAKREWFRLSTEDFVVVVKGEVERQRILEEKVRRKHFLGFFFLSSFNLFFLLT